MCNNFKKPSKYKKGDVLKDGIKIKQVYFFDDELHYLIFLDSDYNVKYRLGEGCNDQIETNVLLGQVASELILVPKRFRKDINLFLAKTYQMLITARIDGEANVDKNISLLFDMIAQRKKIIKKYIFLSTPIALLLFISVLLTMIGIHNLFLADGFSILKFILFLTIGNYLSISNNIKKVEFNSSETTLFYFLFAVFKYFASVGSALILIVLYNSNIININVESDNYELVLSILAAVGGYAEALVPNIFENISKTINGSLTNDTKRVVEDDGD